ncbi:MAG: SIS domain-containing protein [Acidobacteria bacterium]|nr:SIS domain-containing protein [Acidobacteriota bacterium]
MTFSEQYLADVQSVIRRLDGEALERLASSLAAVRDRNGRILVAGLGGGASLAAHAASDLRMTADLEAYAFADNVPELTARINDYGWNTAITGWLKATHFSRRDSLLVFSVGGGSVEKGVSVPLVEAMKYGREIGSEIYSIVGPSGGFAKEISDICILIPAERGERLTPITESVQAVVLHLLVSHPTLKRRMNRWEYIYSSSTENKQP